MADKPHLHVEFFIEPVQDVTATREQGRPIFRDEEYVRVRIAGDPKNTMISPAHIALGIDRETGEQMTYATRFPEHYKLFQQGVTAPVIGTPLAEMPWLTASRIKELQALNIMTVEALSQLDGANLQRLGMGGRELKNQATAWIGKAAGTVNESRFAAELTERDNLIASLQAQVAALAAGKPIEEAAEPATEDDADQSLGENSPFWAWEDEDIKNWIKDNAGARPSGTPSHKTLVAKADALNAELSAKQMKAA